MKEKEKNEVVDNVVRYYDVTLKAKRNGKYENFYIVLKDDDGKLHEFKVNPSNLTKTSFRYFMYLLEFYKTMQQK